ncbi:MAG: NADH-dependent alcohol dehydrogenase [Salinivirgaceae bacterium]|nr:MAG: NADH-dependent alcohol dehydrogenase [Salinivirgaceae bacterium]
MENFVAYNPVKLHFGKGVVDTLGQEALQYGKKALLMYGKGSSVKNGYYDNVLKQLTSSGIEVVEYNGIKSNPIYEDVEKAVAIARKNEVDMVVALGGGSVIDSAKIATLCIPANLNPWHVMIRQQIPEKATPLLTVLTLAATGSEMNAAAVLQNHKTGQKIGFVHPLAYPKQSFLDPTYTFSVPRNYTAYGVVDMIAHALEAYFGLGTARLTDKFIVSIIQEAMHYGPLVLKEPENYDYRANVMWAGTAALNGMTTWGKKYGDWGVHGLGHELSLQFDVPHGASLSIAYPAWMKLQIEKAGNKIAALGQALWGESDIRATIRNFENFFESIESPIRLQQAGIDVDKRDNIIKGLNANKASGFAYPMNDKEHQTVVDFMYEGAL